MTGKTNIEWTDKTWNPIVGCSVTSPGCTNCYAMKFANRMLDGNPKSPHYEGTTRKVNGNAVWTGKVAMAPDSTLTAPLRWRKPAKIFVNSMGDLFHPSVPFAWVDKVFAVMALTPRHIYQILTKHPNRMREYLLQAEGTIRTAVRVNCMRDSNLGNPQDDITWPLLNVWLGVSTEDQARADERIPALLRTPAAVRFASAEPLLGPIRYDRIVECEERAAKQETVSGWYIDALSGDAWDDENGQLTGEYRDDFGTAKLDWVIAGGESGPDARPMHPDWARSLRDQCAEADVAFFFKQWGEWADASDWPSEVQESYDARGLSAPGAIRVGKKAAGNLLNGTAYHQFPAGNGGAA